MRRRARILVAIRLGVLRAEYTCVRQENHIACWTVVKFPSSLPPSRRPPSHLQDAACVHMGLEAGEGVIRLQQGWKGAALVKTQRSYIAYFWLTDAPGWPICKSATCKAG